MKRRQVQNAGIRAQGRKAENMPGDVRQGGKKEKVLMLASVASMIDQFNMPNIWLLQEMGYEVHAACNFREGNTCSRERMKEFQKTLQGMGVVRHQWDCPREIRPADKCWRAYRQLCRLMERESFAWMHCHSPVGGALARLAAHRAGIPVIYTAHGFHFYKGALFKNWLLYYPVEKFLARWTDVLITVNKEDCRLAEKKFQAGKVCYTPGVGVDIEKYAGSRKQHNPASGRADAVQRISRMQFRRKYGIPENALVLLSVGELSRRKNHRTAIRALAEMKRTDVYYVVCGQGALREKLMREARRRGVSKQVVLAGFQSRVEEFYRNADIFVFPSLQEGMPAALMEAMAAGLPCVVSDIRGNRELIKDMRFSPRRAGRLKAVLLLLAEDARLRAGCGQRNRNRVCGCDIRIVEKKMREIYADMKQRNRPEEMLNQNMLNHKMLNQKNAGKGRILCR